MVILIKKLQFCATFFATKLQKVAFRATFFWTKYIDYLMPKNYKCVCCNYSTNRHSSYKKHLVTKKHLLNVATFDSQKNGKLSHENGKLSQNFGSFDGNIFDES
jgi:hypothetical protein